MDVDARICRFVVDRYGNSSKEMVANKTVFYITSNLYCILNNRRNSLLEPVMNFLCLSQRDSVGWRHGR